LVLGWRSSFDLLFSGINYTLFVLKDACREFEERVGQPGSPKGAKAEMVFAAIRAQRGKFRLADLERACPGVGREWIRKLLVDLRGFGKVACRGKGLAARWRVNSGSSLKA